MFFVIIVKKVTIPFDARVALTYYHTGPLVLNNQQWVQCLGTEKTMEGFIKPCLVLAQGPGLSLFSLSVCC